ncbi:hypothetical protein, partial [uncultured Granulicatella sp.]|uniref:hypothetical protein n=1 Tax=uncultured Granulicatella sp. TaxID=316089 RepID=UPI0028ED7E9B
HIKNPVGDFSPTGFVEQPRINEKTLRGLFVFYTSNFHCLPQNWIFGILQKATWLLNLRKGVE